MYYFEKLDELNSTCIKSAHVENGVIAVEYIWEHLVKDSFISGSYVICEEDPNWAPKDIDFAVLIDPDVYNRKKVKDIFNIFDNQIKSSLTDIGFYYTGLEYEGTHFEVMRHREIYTHNLIVFTDPYEFETYRISTNLAKEQKLFKKEDRVALFESTRNKRNLDLLEINWV